MEIKIFDRTKNEYFFEAQYGQKSLRFLYETVLGRILLRLFVSGKIVSKIGAIRMHSKSSVSQIGPFIKKHGINAEDYEEQEYKSFSDFFTRKIKEGKRLCCNDSDALISVADSKLTYYKIDDDLCFKIKNSIYTVNELIKDDNISEQFKNGICLIFRLTVDDYHHYCYPDKGKVLFSKKINGKLHTVSPISGKRYKVYSENCREITLLETENFGEIIQIEVGAMLVGKINNKINETFEKGEEKGYFDFGASTCILLLKNNDIKIDDDIIKNSAKGIETKVLFGEKIGKRKMYND